MASRGPRKSINGFDLSQSPSHLLRRCVQYANDLFSHEPTASDLTKQQYTVLVAVEQNEGVSQTDLVALTGAGEPTKMVNLARGGYHFSDIRFRERFSPCRLSRKLL